MSAATTSALRRKPRRGTGLAFGIARAGPIQEDDAVVLPQTLAQRVGEVLHLRREAVHQHDRLALALVEIVDARALDVDELADRR